MHKTHIWSSCPKIHFKLLPIHFLNLQAAEMVKDVELVD